MNERRPAGESSGIDLPSVMLCAVGGAAGAAAATGSILEENGSPIVLFCGLMTALLPSVSMSRAFYHTPGRQWLLMSASVIATVGVLMDVVLRLSAPRELLLLGVSALLLIVGAEVFRRRVPVQSPPGDLRWQLFARVPQVRATGLPLILLILASAASVGAVYLAVQAGLAAAGVTLCGALAFALGLLGWFLSDKGMVAGNIVMLAAALFAGTGTYAAMPALEPWALLLAAAMQYAFCFAALHYRMKRAYRAAEQTFR